MLKVEEQKMQRDIAVARVSRYGSHTAKHPKATMGFQSLGLTLSEYHILNHRNMVFKWENTDLLNHVSSCAVTGCLEEEADLHLATASFLAVLDCDSLP